MSSKEEILQLLKSNDIKYVDLWFTDVVGAVKNLTVPVSRIEHVIDIGIHFDGSSLDGLARVAESDMVLKPDLSTFTTMSGLKKHTARLICSAMTTQGEPFIGDPRTVLHRAIKRAEEMGFTFKTGVELEFFLFGLDEHNKPIIDTSIDFASYYDLASDNALNVRQDMMESLSTIGIPVDSSHSEVGFGQHEIDLGHMDVLESADSVLTARVVMKSIALRHKLHCTFIPRPATELPGSGMHIHQSLHDLETGENVFVDTDNEYGLSDIARYFLAGQLYHAPAMAAIVAPLVNSYKRLGTSFEAPVYITWAHINRAALIRVPEIMPGEDEDERIRLELRCPDPSANPYLSSAVMLMAGLDGIRNKMPLPDPLEETLLAGSRKRRRQFEMLPNSLGAALQALKQDDVILNTLGPYISDRYISSKLEEYDDYKRHVTEWEIERYINRY